MVNLIRLQTKDSPAYFIVGFTSIHCRIHQHTSMSGSPAYFPPTFISILIYLSVQDTQHTPCSTLEAVAVLLVTVSLFIVASHCRTYTCSIQALIEIPRPLNIALLPNTIWLSANAKANSRSICSGQCSSETFVDNTPKGIQDAVNHFPSLMIRS
jgi:hypothetical protein